MRPDSRHPLFDTLSRGSLLGLVLATLAGRCATAAPPPAAPAVFGVGERTPLLVVHAEGAQLYECKPAASGGGAWTFREPIAALIKDGKTIGRHYAGPTWELDDGGAVKGKVAASAAAATAADIPLLELNVIDRRGAGALKDATQAARHARRRPRGTLSGRGRIAPGALFGRLRVPALSVAASRGSGEPGWRSDSSVERKPHRSCSPLPSDRVPYHDHAEPNGYRRQGPESLAHFPNAIGRLGAKCGHWGEAKNCPFGRATHPD